MRKTNVFLIISFLLLVSAWNMSGCAKNKEEPQADTERVNCKLKREMTETESSEVPETENDIDKQEEKEFPDDIFYWGAEEYFYLLEGEWVAAEYAGTITETGFDEVWEEWYQEEQQKYTDEVIEKYLGSEYRVELDNLLCFAPYSDLALILEDDGELFSVTRFIPREFITMTPPYIALSAQLVDNDEEYQFIIDADGTVLIEIKYHFFRLERKEGQDSAAVKGEEDDADYVLYLEDEGVRDNPVFAAFIDKEITAYDAETEENRDIYECYKQALFGDPYGIHYMAEDLDGDGNDELLVLLQWDDCDGDLLVFHEEDGKLYQWETWEYFMWMRMLEIEYHGNGIFSMGGGAGDIVGRYNTEGKIEYIAKYFRSWGHTEEGKYWKSGHLILYEDGQEGKELRWEGIYFHEDDTMEMTPENQANYDEFVAIMHKIWEEIGEGRRIKDIEYEENTKKIPMAEVFDN